MFRPIPILISGAVLCLLIPANATGAPQNGSRVEEGNRTYARAWDRGQAQERAQRVSFTAARAEIEGHFVPQLEGLARWCHNVKLFGERDRMWTAVVQLRPDHAEARRVLRYRRTDAGWERLAGYKPGVDRNEGVREMFTQRYHRIVDPYKLRLLRLLNTYRKDPALGPAQREQVLEHLLQVDPNDAQVHAALGMTWHEGRWILNESLRTLEGRSDIALFARAAMEWAPEPEPTETTEEERGLGLVWAGKHETSSVRVLGTTTERETKATARVTHAAEHYFEHVFRLRQKHRDRFTVFLLSSSTEREALLRTVELDATREELARQSAGGWLTPTAIGQWNADPAGRLDGAARQTLGAMLMDAYGIDGRHGWAWEGIGLYLVYHLTGTRLTYFFDHTGSRLAGDKKPVKSTRSAELWSNLQAPDADWLAEGRALLARPDAPKLEFLLGRNISRMQDEDMLVAYVLAAYLLEGWPREAPDLLRRIGAGQHPVKAFESGLGYSLQQIERRLRRWLAETN